MSFPRGTSRLSFEPVVFVDERGYENIFSAARYAKGKVLFRIQKPPPIPGESRWKGPGERLAEAVGGRYSGREHGYIISPAAADKLLRYLQEGWDAEYAGKLVPPESAATTEESTMTRRTARKTAPDAEAAGAQHAQEELEGDHFTDWVRAQLLEASHMDPSTVLPLETKADAKVIAKNMLQQLRWDASRDLTPRDIAQLIGVDEGQENVKDFFKGFQETLDASRDWLADELLEINRGLRGGGVSEARSPEELRIGSTITLPAGWPVGMGKLRHDTLVTITRVDTSSDGTPMYGVKWTDTKTGVDRTSWIGQDDVLILRNVKHGVSETRQGINRDKIQRALSYVHYWESPRAGPGRKTRADAALEAIRGEGLNDAETDILLRSIHVDRDEILAARTARKEGKGGVREAGRRAHPQPLTDTKLYSVTWAGGRQGNLTDREAVDLVRQLRNDWVEAGRRGQLNIQVWYRDGSLVPYADLERRFSHGGPGVKESRRSAPTRGSGRPPTPRHRGPLPGRYLTIAQEDYEAALRGINDPENPIVWEGPFSSEENAREFIESEFGVPAMVVDLGADGAREWERIKGTDHGDAEIGALLRQGKVLGRYDTKQWGHLRLVRTTRRTR